MSYKDIANGMPMLIICCIVLAVVIIQPIIMMKMARKRGKEIGLTSKEMNKVVKSTAIFSIIPSLPVLASYLVLVPALGKYFPWLRLSVVGSVTYETTVAASAANAFGFSNIYDSDFPYDVFLSILLILTIGILAGNVFNLIFLKTYDKNVKKLMAKQATVIPAITGAIFVALYTVLATPTITNFKNPVGILTLFFTGLVATVSDSLANVHPKLKEHSFSISLILGMIFACIINPFFN